MTDNWAAHAACIGAGDVMFGDDPVPAKAICRRCPVKAQCLDFALDGDILDGVWGGKDFEERTRLCPICRRDKAPDALGCSGTHSLERLARLIELQQSGDITVSVSIRSTPTAATTPGCPQLRGRSHSSAKAYRQGCRCTAALLALEKERAARVPGLARGSRNPQDTRSASERFMDLVEVEEEGDHWRWKGSTNGSGYGNFWDGKRIVRAHLFAYQTFVGPICGRLRRVDEKAPQPCVNPSHFKLISSTRDQCHQI